MILTPWLLCVFLISRVSTSAISTAQRCKCAPDDACWPSVVEWNALNASVSGNLISDSPIAASCYPGPLQDSSTCQLVETLWTSQAFQAANPIGLSFPDESCVPVNASADQKPGQCSIGTSPRYTVNATSPDLVSKTITFAKEKNVRLVIKNTGHDLLGRSTGYGSISVWIHYLRDGVEFHDSYDGANCPASGWRGAAFTVRGGYTWEDLYPLAAARNVVVVGGGTPSVSVLGGWMSGGGHGPAVHEYGLGADQLLSAVIVLASGATVTASACSNRALFFAIRGGGGGTYGVVIQTTIKAYPVTPVSAIQLSIAPNTENDLPAFMDALTIIHASYPNLSDLGFSGYGSWSISSPTPIVENYTGSYPVAGFTQIYAIFNTSLPTAQHLFSTLPAKLHSLNLTSSLYINTRTYSFPTYWTYYATLSNISSPVGQSAALGSRLLDRAALTANLGSLKSTLQILAGDPAEYTSMNVVFVGGGAIASLRDPNSGVNPAWRSAYVHNIVARGWAPGTSASVQQSIRSDVTDVKVGAMKRLAPGTGAYMNEGDVNDEDFERDFYGAHWSLLGNIKARYDPEGVFYCPTCVGSEEWRVDEGGRLCRV